MAASDFGNEVIHALGEADALILGVTGRTSVT